MPSIRAARDGARLGMLVFAALLLCFFGVESARAHHGLPHFPHPPHHIHPPLAEPPQPPPPPPPVEVTKPPPAESPLPPISTTGGSTTGTAGAVGKGRGSSKPGPRPPQEVVVEPTPAPPEPPKKAKKDKDSRKEAKPGLFATSEPIGPVPASSNPERSELADRVLAPDELHLDAEHLAESGLLTFLLVALLYLPVMIFNKATEKNHATISAWFARPKAWMAAFTTRIPFSGHPLGTLAGGVVASTALFAFIEPKFPTEDGSLEYLIGMLLGFTLVSTAFFATWRWVIHRLEPESEGHWRIYPPYILLAAVLVVFARLAHFLPGVVLGTVAEYEPAKRLSVRTAGIRVASTYCVLIVLGLVAWFAWIPVSHAAEEEHASAITLILDSMLAITFVTALESVAFGLIPMKFLDGHDLITWRKGLWALMWGGALFWFALVILNPALSTYGHHASHTQAIWLILLFSSLMIVAVSTWGYFRLRDARLAKAARGASG